MTLLFLLLSISVPVKAEWQDSELADELQVDELLEYAEDNGLDEYGTLKDFRVWDALSSLLQRALKAAISEEVLQVTVASLLIVLLCSLLRSVLSVSGTKLDVLTLTGAAAISVLTMSGNGALTKLSVETLGKAQDLANVLLPVLSGASLLSGAVTASATKYAAATFFLNVLLNLSVNGIVPIVRLYTAAAAAEAASGSELLSGVLGFMKRCATLALTVILIAFSIYISVCGLVQGTTDAAVLRGAKTTISTVLPLVGSIASDAAASVLAAAGVLRQSVGVFGLVALAAALLLPFLRAGVQYLLFKGAAGISAGLADKRLHKLLERLSEAMAMLLACIGSCGLMLFLSIYSLMKVTLG